MHLSHLSSSHLAAMRLAQDSCSNCPVSMAISMALATIHTACSSSSSSSSSRWTRAFRCLMGPFKTCMALAHRCRVCRSSTWGWALACSALMLRSRMTALSCSTMAASSSNILARLGHSSCISSFRIKVQSIACSTSSRLYHPCSGSVLHLPHPSAITACLLRLQPQD